MLCPNCGKDHHPLGECLVDPQQPKPAFPLYGWICPRCGRGNSPSTQTCPCVPAPPVPFTVTC